MSGIEPLLSALKDPAVVELMINPDGSAYAEIAGKGVQRLMAAPTRQDAAALLEAVTGLKDAYGPGRPYADLSATDGSRVHVMAEPLARGLAVTIRKRPERRPSLAELVKNGTLSAQCGDFLSFAVKKRLNVMVVGGTSSGKTTLLSALAGQAGADERLIVLEDTPELALPQRHALYLRTRLRDIEGRPDVTLRELVINTLRMRPDRVIVGETRSVEAFDMLQAMNVGCEGMLTTLHANSTREALLRLETLVLQAGADMPLKAVRGMMVSALDLIVFMARLPDGSRRVLQVSEVTGLEVETVTMSELYLFEPRKGPNALRATGTIPRLYERLRKIGEDPPLAFFASN